MGFLIDNVTPLDWEASKEFLAYVREHGVDQFLQVYHSTKGYSGDVLKFGDELEYHICALDHTERKVRVSLRGRELLALLDTRESAMVRGDHRYEACTWHPEFGSWMIESTPKDGALLRVWLLYSDTSFPSSPMHTMHTIDTPPAQPTVATPPTCVGSRKTCGCAALVSALCWARMKFP